MSDSHTYSAEQKLKGYEAALSDAGYSDFRRILKFYTKNDIHYIQDILLAHRTLEFDSVLACNDSLGVGALKYAKARGIKVPEELSVTGYNNSGMAVCSEPELTSVDNHLEQICYDTIENMVKSASRGERCGTK